MSGIALLLVLLVLARQAGGGGGGELPTIQKPRDLPYSPTPVPSPTPLPPVAQAAKNMPPPWPQAMPTGLPPWGPAGWQPDEPPPVQVQARAWQLLSQLWKYGAGTRKTEQTAGRWITYVATPMGSKKGVVAYRPRDQVSSQPPLDATAPVAAA